MNKYCHCIIILKINFKIKAINLAVFATNVNIDFFFRFLFFFYKIIITIIFFFGK